MASPKAALTDLKELFPEVELRILRAALFIHGFDIQKASEYLLDEVCPGHARRNVSSETGSTGNASLGTGAASEGSGPQPSIVHSLQPQAIAASAKHFRVPESSTSADSSLVDGLDAEGQLDGDDTSTAAETTDILDGKQMDALNSGPDVVGEEAEEAAQKEAEKGDHTRGLERNVVGGTSQCSEQSAEKLLLVDSVDERLLVGESGEETELASSQDSVLNPSPDEEEMVLEASALSVHGEAVIGGDSGFLSALVGSGSICQSLGSVCEPVNVKEFDAALEQADTVKDLQQRFAAARSLESAVRTAEEAARMAEMESVRGGEVVEEKVREIVELVARAKEESQAKSAKNLAEKGVISEEMAALQRDLQKAADNKTVCEKALEEIHLSLQKRVRVANERVASAHAHKLALEDTAQEQLREQQQHLEQAVAELEALTEEEAECTELQRFITSRVEAVDKLQGEVDVISEDVEMLKLRLAAHHSPSASTSSSGHHPLTLIDSVRDRLLELHSESHVSTTHTPGTPASLSPRSARSADAVFSRSESLRSEGRLYLPPLQMGLFGKKVEENEEDWVNVEGSGGKSSAATPATSGSSQSSIRSN